MARKPVKPARLEDIYILRGTQIGNPELARGCYLPPRKIFSLDKKYESVEKTAAGKTVKFKISEEDAGKLILENAAVNVKKIKDKGWVACDVYGKPLEEAIPIILDTAKKAEKVDTPPA